MPSLCFLSLSIPPAAFFSCPVLSPYFLEIFLFFFLFRSLTWIQNKELEDMCMESRRWDSGSEGTGTLWRAEPKFWLCDLAMGPTGSVIPLVGLRPGVRGGRPQGEREGTPPTPRGNASRKVGAPPGQPWSHFPERGLSEGPAAADVP